MYVNNQQIRKKTNMVFFLEASDCTDESRKDEKYVYSCKNIEKWYQNLKNISNN